MPNWSPPMLTSEQITKLPEKLRAFATQVDEAEHIPGLSGDIIAVPRADVLCLLATLAEAEKFVILAPDPEVAAAVEAIEDYMLDSTCCPPRPEERAALTLLINRASGVTVLRLREEVAAWRAEVMRLRGELVKALALTRAQAAAYDERLADREQTIATLQDREACADVDAEATERDAARWRALRSADVIDVRLGMYGVEDLYHATNAGQLDTIADERCAQAAATGGKERT